MIRAALLKARVVVAALGVALVWQLVVWSGVASEKYFPGIDKVALAFAQMAASGELFAQGALTLERAAFGLIGATALGLALALLSDVSPFFRRGFQPIAAALHSLPPAAFTPMAIFALGLGPKLYAFVIILVAVWPVYFNGVAALASVGRAELDAGRMLGLRPLALLFEIKLPAAAPEIFVGVRYAGANATIAAVVCEMLAGRNGLGFQLFQKAFANRTADVFALMFAAGFCGLILQGLILAARWRLAGWRLQMTGAPA